ncbi:MAG TPA: Ig-like domain-containing protein [Abditibacteriaceae bacterium]
MRYFSLLSRASIVLAAATTVTTAHAVDDTTPPVGSAVAPKLRDYLKSLSLIRVSATDNVGVSKGNVYLRRSSDLKFWNGTNWVTEGAFLTLAPSVSGSSTLLSRTTNLPQAGTDSAIHLTEGRYTTTTYIYDAANNRGSVLSTFDVDRTAPIPTITAPAAGAYISSLLPVRGTAVDNAGGAGVASVSMLLRRSSDGAFWNGTSWLTTQTLLPTTLSTSNWTSAVSMPAGTNLEEGRYIIYAYAYDRSGNRNASAAIREFTVDKTTPTVLFDNPKTGSAIKKLEVLHGMATDNSGRISRVIVSLRRSLDGAYWNGSAWGTTSVYLSAAMSGTAFSGTSLPLPGTNTTTQIQDGFYTALAYSYDAAGNRSTTYARTDFTIDNALPAGTVTSPVNGATGITALTRVGGTASDSASGIANVQVTFSRPTSTGGFEVWARRSGIWGWATTAGDLPVAVVAAVGSRSTTWTVETNLPSGTNLRTGQHYVAAAIFDRAGNRYVTNVNSFTVGAAVDDNVRVNSPATSTTVASLPAIEGRAIDAQGVSKVAIALSRRTSNGTVEIWGYRAGLGWGTTQPTAPLFATLTAPGATDTGFRLASNLPSGTNLAPGAYFVAAQMLDARNNSITSAVNSFTVTSPSALYAGNYNINWVSVPLPDETAESGAFVLNVSTSGVATAQLTLEDAKYNTIEGTFAVVENGATVDQGEIYLEKTVLGDSYAGSYSGEVYSETNNESEVATATVSTSGVLTLKVTASDGTVDTFTGTVNMTTGAFSINEGNLAIGGSLLRHDGIIRITGTVNANGVLTAELQSDHADVDDDTMTGDLDSVGTSPLRGRGVITDVDSSGTSQPGANWTSSKQ